jgi:hypothetical protein
MGYYPVQSGDIFQLLTYIINGLTNVNIDDINALPLEMTSRRAFIFYMIFNSWPRE